MNLYHMQVQLDRTVWKLNCLLGNSLFILNITKQAMSDPL